MLLLLRCEARRAEWIVGLVVVIVLAMMTMIAFMSVFFA